MTPEQWLEALNGIRQIIRLCAEVKEAAIAEGFSEEQAFVLSNTTLATVIAGSGKASE